MKLEINWQSVVFLLLLAVASRGDLTSFVMIFLCVVLHEAGHIVAAKLCGVRVKAIGCNFLGAYIRRERSEQHDRVIAACGPMVNLLLIPFTTATPQLFVFNLTLLLFNLTTVKGADGNLIWKGNTHGRRKETSFA